ncbi:MAG: hypothetical protein HYX59_01030 [Elusimicrobia bacterium]|nr:hypothetical protein [Elusimicrobiota bacterium]
MQKVSVVCVMLLFSVAFNSSTAESQPSTNAKLVKHYISDKGSSSLIGAVVANEGFFLKKNLADLDALVHKKGVKQNGYGGLYSSAEVTSLLAETEIKYKCFDAVTKTTSEPRPYMKNLRRYPFSLESMSLCQDLSMTAGMLLGGGPERPEALSCGNDLSALAVKWCAHSYRLAKIYELSHFAQSYGDETFHDWLD